MKHGVTFLMVLSPVLAYGDYTPTQAHWPGWKIYTSEDLSWGSKYKGYPIGNMFDEKPATAWVFKGVQMDPKKTGYSRSSQWGGEYAISIKFGAKLRLDGLQIMNGYNKSQEVFLRNNRVTEIQIYSGLWYERELLKTVALPDRMGWHSISLPPRDYDRLTLVFSKMVAGRDNDVAISGLRLTRDGVSVGPRTPTSYVITDGDECGCFTEYKVVRADGYVIARISDEVRDYFYSNDGRHLLGFTFIDDESSEAWIVDMVMGRIVVRRKLPWADTHEVRWEKGSVVVWPSGEEKRAVRIRF